MCGLAVVMGALDLGGGVVFVVLDFCGGSFHYHLSDLSTNLVFGLTCSIVPWLSCLWWCGLVIGRRVFIALALWIRLAVTECLEDNATSVFQSLSHAIST